MNKALFSIFLLLAVASSAVSGFNVNSAVLSGVGGGSTFVTSQRPRQAVRPEGRASAGVSNLQMMGGKKAKFGIFSPAVYGAKIVLGDDKLNKFRGKAISLHSQYIGDFCRWSGAYHLRTRLIKLAKTNGDTLGFLV
mmetsp:Transcript_14283/g.29407  ORF Transcript_14283/g.29407 Transcript_14283/m.29407 type:complete len:137 (-) Transcript_14283:179-589(-)